METRADHEPSDDPSPPAAAAAYLPWILLENFGSCDDPDARTVAHGRTSKDRPFTIALVLAAPPAVSRLRVDCPGLPDGVYIVSHAMAAHGDSVLAKIETRRNPRMRSNSRDDDDCADDYFLYCAGDARTSRPPSLSPLPPCYLTEQDQLRRWRAPAPKKTRYMDTHGPALLRRGQDEVVVAALDFRDTKNLDDVLEAELCFLRSGDWEWELKRLPVIHDEGKREEVSRWQTDRVVPVGDRFLLWVDYFRGIVYSDLWQETPELRYVSLPVEQDPWRSQDRWGPSYRTVCATNGGRSVRFAEIFPRCCCGCPGAQPWIHQGIACAVSRYAFTITTWELSMDDMTTWNKVRVVDCHELWSLPGYHGAVPRVRPQYPTVSLDDPDVLCFVVNKTTYDTGVDGDLGTWLIEFDTSRIEIRSILYYHDRQFFFGPKFIASSVSQYFDTSSRNSSGPARGKDTDLEAPARPSKVTFPRVASPEEMMATLREIPNLVHDDMMKAYGVLASDDGQYMFRSLLALPMDMRKDYCLLVEKLPCFDV